MKNYKRNENGRIELGIKLHPFQFTEKDDIMHIEKSIGGVLDFILCEMEEQELEVPAELQELKQWLRFKGNSFREDGDNRYWDVE